jgi:tRNA threonylcarbamoyl adenosine modification protein (Sua5/YciO/YrdC/YwlC family)
MMMLKIHGTPPNSRHIEAATKALEKGDVVLAPTETGYCFFADAARDDSYESLLSLRKAHPRQKPFSILCSSLKQVASLALLPTPVFRAASRVLPGPYTLLLEATKQTPQSSQGPKRKSVGIRMSSHAVAQALAEGFGKPLVLTSVTDAEELMQGHYFEGMSDLAQDPDSWWVSPEAILAKFKGRIAVALEWHEFVPMRVSTVVDFTQHPPTLVRNGGWPLESLGLID